VCLATAGLVDAAVDICGITDITEPEKQHPPISWDFIAQYMSVPHTEDPKAWADASPLYAVTPQTAPTLIIHGRDDDVVWSEQSVKLHEALERHGVDTELILLPCEGHSFSLDAFREILQKSIEFFRRYLH
jgi:dipeptidyl aminopeptidase/acylaminoacyl peptidase